MQACCHAGGKTSLHACVAAIVALQMQPGSSHTCDNLMDWTELLVQHMPGPKQRCKTAYNSLGCWYIPEKNGQTNQEQCAAKLVYILFGQGFPLTESFAVNSQIKALMPANFT